MAETGSRTKHGSVDHLLFIATTHPRTEAKDSSLEANSVVSEWTLLYVGNDNAFGGDELAKGVW